MINNKQFSYPKHHASGPTLISPNGNVSGLVSAASIDPVFCQKLLNDPRSAVKTGWYSETFKLTPPEMDLLLSVRGAETIQDFARQLLEIFNA